MRELSQGKGIKESKIEQGKNQERMCPQLKSSFNLIPWHTEG